MDTTRTDLCVKHLDDFDIVSTETVTRTRNLDVKIDTDDGNAILVPLAMLKFYLDRRRRGNDVRAVDPALERWVDRHNLDDLYNKVKQAEKNTSKDTKNHFLDTSKVMNMSLQHLSSGTIDDIAARPAYYHAMKLNYGDFDETEGWLMPIPDSMGAMPQDLKDCFIFADRMNASFVCFLPYAPLYADIYSQLNIGDCPMD